MACDPLHFFRLPPPRTGVHSMIPRDKQTLSHPPCRSFAEKRGGIVSESDTSSHHFRFALAHPHTATTPPPMTEERKMQTVESEHRPSFTIAPTALDANPDDTEQLTLPFEVWSECMTFQHLYSAMHATDCPVPDMLMACESGTAAAAVIDTGDAITVPGCCEAWVTFIKCVYQLHAAQRTGRMLRDAEAAKYGTTDADDQAPDAPMETEAETESGGERKYRPVPGLLDAFFDSIESASVASDLHAFVVGVYERNTEVFFDTVYVMMFAEAPSVLLDMFVLVLAEKVDECPRTRSGWSELVAKWSHETRHSTGLALH